jgi:uncharacterized protein YwbE
LRDTTVHNLDSTEIPGHSGLQLSITEEVDHPTDKIARERQPGQLVDQPRMPHGIVGRLNVEPHNDYFPPRRPGVVNTVCESDSDIGGGTVHTECVLIIWEQMAVFQIIAEPPRDDGFEQLRIRWQE